MLTLFPGPVGAVEDQSVSCPQDLTRGIPARPADALGGTHFAARVAPGNTREREDDIKHEILRGNLPSFLRWLKPVRLKSALADGRNVTATICVMPDYLSIGADRDFLRIPMDLRSATEVATRFGFVLPTPKMVDAIYRQSAAHLTPLPMRPGPQMRSTDYYLRHNRRIAEQRTMLGISLGALISGHKKDVVISNRLASRPDRIAIYGWHKPDGRPIQPLSTVHSANYADYSHGIRLVSDVMYLDGKPASVREVLQDSKLAAILSREGPMKVIARLIPRPPAPLAYLGLSPRPAPQRGGAANTP